MKNNKTTRRNFIKQNVNMGMGLASAAVIPFITLNCRNSKNQQFSTLNKGAKQLFADDEMIYKLTGVQRKVHPASKLAKPVLEADMPWEQGELYEGRRDRRVYIYGSVLRDPDSGLFRMWYNRLSQNYYATSKDGTNWHRPNLGQLGENNMIQLFDFHSPSIIRDQWFADPEKLYKAVGSTRSGYFAAYSADGLKWHLYPKNPILNSRDTITLAQDPINGEYLAFHKVNKDPRVTGRQVFLSVSKDMQNWTEPEPVMVTDEIDHQAARLLDRGTHSEFYNMSAFPHANQWLGLVTHFRRTGQPLVIKHKGGGHAQSLAEGLIDIQLAHSRDGRKWQRCSDRSPVIPLGPYPYDSGSILGLCNSPVFVGDEMWMYYTAMTTSHGGALPDKEMSIALASWRLDGMVSFRADERVGVIETETFIPEGSALFVNADCRKGNLAVEVLDVNRKVIERYSKNDCQSIKVDGVKQSVAWSQRSNIPSGRPISLRFFLENGDLFSYVIE